MRVQEDYRTCDRCNERIDEHWYRKLTIRRFKERWFFGGIVHDSNLDLCAICTEKFEKRFMEMKPIDSEPTEYERYYSERDKNV